MRLGAVVAQFIPTLCRRLNRCILRRGVFMIAATHQIGDGLKVKPLIGRAAFAVNTACIVAEGCLWRADVC